MTVGQRVKYYLSQESEPETSRLFGTNFLSNLITEAYGNICRNNKIIFFAIIKYKYENNQC